MAAEVHTHQQHHDDLHEHPAKKLRTVDGTSCRRSNLGVRVASALQATNELPRDASEPHAPAGFAEASSSSSSAQATDPDPPLELAPAPAIEGSDPVPAPVLLLRPQLEQQELASSLDGWLKHNQQLPKLKKLRRDSTCSMQSLDAWMDTGGYTSPVPGSPQWFRLQPSPARQAMRASPSIEIQVLSPVFPEQYPDDIDMMSEGDADDDFSLSPPSPANTAAASPRPDRVMASPATTPRRRAPSRLGWRSPRPQSADPADPQAAALGGSRDGTADAAGAPLADAGSEAVAAAAAQLDDGGGGGDADDDAACSGGGAAAHNAAELRALEFRLLQLLHTGNGMVLVADALRLFRGYMEEAADKDAVRAMLKRWCVLVEHPVGSGCRWLYLRSAAEAAGATIPDA